MAKGPHIVRPSTEGKLSMEEFARRVRLRLLQPCDRFGVPLEKDDAILYRPADDMVFQVVDVRPVMDPRAPLGAVHVDIAARATLTMFINRPTPGVLKYGSTKPVTGDAPTNGNGELTDATRPDQGQSGGDEPTGDATPPVDLPDDPTAPGGDDT